MEVEKYWLQKTKGIFLNYFSFKKLYLHPTKNKSIYFLLVFFATFFSLGSINALAENASQSVNEPLILLSKQLGDLNTFQGDFEQVITDEDGDVVEENEGEFLLKRPGFFRWYIKPPFEKLMVSNNKTIWTYDPDLKQATADVVDDRLLQTPMLLLSGDLEQIRLNYSVSISNSNDKKNNTLDLQRYKLVPKNDDGLFEWMEIIFSNDRVVGMTLFSELGEIQRYTFSETQQNKKIDDSKFTFDVPADVDVIVND